MPRLLRRALGKHRVQTGAHPLAITGEPRLEVLGRDSLYRFDIRGRSGAMNHGGIPSIYGPACGSVASTGPLPYRCRTRCRTLLSAPEHELAQPDIEAQPCGRRKFALVELAAALVVLRRSCRRPRSPLRHAGARVVMTRAALRDW